MRFGIEFGSYPADTAPAEAVQQISARAQRAYKNNFEALFVAQHYLSSKSLTSRKRRSIALRSAAGGKGTCTRRKVSNEYSSRTRHAAFSGYGVPGCVYCLAAL